MAELKTKPTPKSVSKFLDAVVDAQRREDCYAILKIMKDVTKKEPVMWGDAIIGFGSYHYKYVSGHEGDMCIVGFSPRKQNITLYVMPCQENFEELRDQLGKIKHGKSCIYIKSINDINLTILKKLIRESIKYIKKNYAINN